MQTNIKKRLKKLSDIKKILTTAKKSYYKVVSENKELKNYIENIKQGYNQYQQQQQAQYIQRERNYYIEKQPKKYKKVIYEEEHDSEPEVEDNDYTSEETEEESAKPKPKKVQQKQKNNIFGYINNDAKRNKRWIFLGETLNPYDDARRSTAIDRTASNYNDAK